MPKTALVTGSAGFVGRHMVQTLRERDYEVHELDIETWNYDTKRSNDCMDQFTGEVENYDRTYDLVVHAAAAAPNRKAIDTQLGNFPYNVMLDAAMFSWAMRVRPKKIVYLSSSAVYRPVGKSIRYTEWYCDIDAAMFPSDVYGWTKLNGEHMARQAQKDGLDVLVVRPFSGYGEDQSENFPFGAIVERVRRLEDPIIVWGSGKQVRDWIHIDDICDAITALLENGAQGPVNLCTGQGTAIGDLARMAVDLAGYSATIKPLGGPHAGVDHRVGHPRVLNTFYEPRVTLSRGIQRRLEMTP